MTLSEDLARPRALTHDPRVNTNVDFYLDQDPHALVSGDIVDFVRARAGRRVLDLGCGIGGYAHRLQQLGFDVVAIDRNPEYVARARSIGVRCELGVGETLPFEDGAFDTVVMVEVLEHLPDDVAPGVLSEVRRVTRGNLLLTVPDCTQFDRFVRERFLPDHFMAVDHVQFFTVDSLASLLKAYFPSVDVREGDPLYPHRLLPAVVRRPLSLAYRLGLLRSTLYSRLYAEARLDA